MNTGDCDTRGAEEGDEADVGVLLQRGEAALVALDDLFTCICLYEFADARLAGDRGSDGGHDASLRRHVFTDRFHAPLELRRDGAVAHLGLLIPGERTNRSRRKED